MNEIPRRTIDELVTTYQLEPTIRHIFVEGEFDSDIFELCYKNNAAFPTVYAIDSIDVPSDLVANYELTDGNKQRVITLACELYARLNKISSSYWCFVDKDLDHWLHPPLKNTPRLIWSKYCSAELYFFDDQLLQQILVATFKCKFDDWQTYKLSLVCALKRLYIARLADQHIKLGIPWNNTVKILHGTLAAKNSSIEFDFDEFIKRVLNQNQKHKNATDFSEDIQKWQNKLNSSNCDPRDHIRGHDMVELLAWSIRNFKGMKECATKIYIERILVNMSPQVAELNSIFAF